MNGTQSDRRAAISTRPHMVPQHYARAAVGVELHTDSGILSLHYFCYADSETVFFIFRIMQFIGIAFFILWSDLSLDVIDWECRKKVC